MNLPKLRHTTSKMIPILGAIILLLSISGAPPAALAQDDSQVENLSEQEQLQTKKKIVEAQERIRLLYSRDRYRQVIEEAEALLEIDPENSTAILHKNSAERKIARGDQPERSGLGNIPSVTGSSERQIEAAAETPVPEESPAAEQEPGEAAEPADPAAGQETEPVDEPAEGTAPAPGMQETQPAQPQSQTSSPSSGGFQQFISDNLLYIGIAVGGGLLLLAIILVIVMVRRSRQPAPARQSAESLTSGASPSGAGSSSLSDLPTVHGADSGEEQQGAQANVFDAPTAVGEEESPAAGDAEEQQQGVADQPTVTEPQEEEEEVAPPIAEEEKKPEQEAPAAEAEAEAEETSRPEEDSVAMPGIGGEEKQEEPKEGGLGQGMNIDYSDTDSEPQYSASQAEDVYQTGDEAFRQAPEEKVQETPETSEASSKEEDTISFDQQEEESSAAEEPQQPAASEEQVEETIPFDAVGEKPSEAPQGKEGLQGADIGQPLPTADEQQSADTAKGEAQTKPLDQGEDKKPEGEEVANAASSQPGASGQDGSEMSYNSLMFGADQTAAPGAESSQQDGEKEQPAAEESSGTGEDEDLTLSSFDRQYSDVMFGSDMEKTKAPGTEQQEQEGSDDSSQQGPDATAPLPGGEPGETAKVEPEEQETKQAGKDQEKTVPVGAAAGSGGGKKPSMFQRQKTAGKEALDSGNFQKAVQCLSVAASLKPGDKEVRTMLEEARKKRHG